jgi:hypothetical protein
VLAGVAIDSGVDEERLLAELANSLCWLFPGLRIETWGTRISAFSREFLAGAFLTSRVTSAMADEISTPTYKDPPPGAQTYDSLSARGKGRVLSTNCHRERRRWFGTIQNRTSQLRFRIYYLRPVFCHKSLFVS